MHLALDLGEGAVFAGQFRVLRPLARGGMGAVYVVEQLGTARRRALKLMHPSLVHDARSRERFEREAQVAARIPSDHVVEVVAAGVEPGTGTPWLCMELLEGEDLAARMRRGRPDAGELRAILGQLGHALAAAHRAGVVHRDLKPENLFLAVPRREGVPFTLKVLDFGVAALVRAAGTSTQAVGSPLWMAPEQADDGRVQAATDVWALGLLAYHLLTGGHYWNAARGPTSVTALLVEVLVEPLPAASGRAQEQGLGPLPAGFDAWFGRCVARDPAARFPEAGAALEALVAVLDGAASGRAARGGPAQAGWRPGRLLVGTGLVAAALLLLTARIPTPPASSDLAAAPPPEPDGVTARGPGEAAALHDGDAGTDAPPRPPEAGPRPGPDDAVDGRPEIAPHRATPHRAGPDASGVARRLRARLDRCVRDNLAGEPAARWTFTLVFNGFGLSTSARIVGPHAGEPEGPYLVFRRCVQGDVAGFDAGGDSGPFAFMLP